MGGESETILCRPLDVATVSGIPRLVTEGGEGGREGGKEREREGGREKGREDGREERKPNT